MSPVPRSGRSVAILLGLALLASLALAVPAGAQDDSATDGNATGGEGSAGEFAAGPQDPTLTDGNFVRHFSIRSLDDGCPGGANPCWDITTLVVQPNDKVLLHADLSSGSHDVTIEWAELKSQSPVGFTDMAVTIPEQVPEEGLEFICSIHPDTMVGTFKLESSLGAHAAAANTLGVHFLAYWVGVIAFAILFIVYGATFFLFKYNETRATTDHWDRSDAQAGSQRLAAVAPLVAVVIAVAAIAAIVYISR